MKKSKALKKAEEQIDLLDYIRKDYRNNIKFLNDNTFRINPCPICGHKDHFTIYANENKYHTYANCANTYQNGGITEYLMEVERFSEEQAKMKVYNLAGYYYSEVKSQMEKDANGDDDYIDDEEQLLKEANRLILEKIRNFKADKKKYIEKNLDRQTEENKEAVCDYLKERGFENCKELTEKYHLFITNDLLEDDDTVAEKTKRLVIPIFENNEPKAYVARAVNPLKDGVKKVVNSKGQQIPLNIDYIKYEPPEDKCIFVCEGWADAFSFEDTGKKAIALNSVANIDKFEKYLTEYAETANKYTYILSFDNDEAGREANLKLKKKLDKLNIKCCEIKIPPEYKDINEWYKNNKNIVGDGLKPFKVDNALEYIDNNFVSEIMLMEQYKKRSTGFGQLDSNLNGIYPNLYVLGAISSMGKTTFSHQIADQLAWQGEHVLYFCLEQSKLELVSKSISRLMFRLKNDRMDIPECSLSIMQNSKGSSLRNKAIEEYRKFADKIHIIEGNFDMTVDKIRRYVESYIAVTGIRPVVFVDYLQILRPTNDRWSDKQQVDYNISELKRMSRDNVIPVFAICSFNRDNYNTKASFSSFKESGGIEYRSRCCNGITIASIK